jgi:hypothetical protein
MLVDELTFLGWIWTCVYIYLRLDLRYIDDVVFIVVYLYQSVFRLVPKIPVNITR